VAKGEELGVMATAKASGPSQLKISDQRTHELYLRPKIRIGIEKRPGL
jgi:hypothetical protein